MDHAALVLVAYSGDDVSVYPLPENGQVTLGRGDGNDVVLKDQAASRRHCIVHTTSPMRVEDLGGANGTFVFAPADPDPDKTRDLRQITRTSTPIAVGDRITVGATMFVVRHAGAPAVVPQRPGVVVQDTRMRELYAQVDRAAQALINVLVLGETGVGKEVLARTVHERSGRATKPFLSINCAAISESLLEAELFGHEKGAFTGAAQAHPGLFESVDGGTLFLDEIGELPAATQVKLLRVLEERKVLRVGGRTPRAIDVRFIAATHRDLEADAETGRFRQDLLFRLNAFTLFIPPLRDRRDEIGPLAALFAATVAKQLDRQAVPTIAPETLRLLEAYSFPGNVRELKNIIERAVVLANGPTLLPEHLPPKVVRERDPSTSAQASRGSSPPPEPLRPEPPPPAASSPGADSAPGSGDRFQAEIRTLERQRIVDALDQCAGNQTRAAELLGVSRRTLSTWLERHKIPRPRKREEG